MIVYLVCAGGDTKTLPVPFQFHLCAAFFQESPVPSSPFGAMITVKSAKQVIKPNTKHFRTTVGNKVRRGEVGDGHGKASSGEPDRRGHTARAWLQTTHLQPNFSLAHPSAPSLPMSSHMVY